MVYKEDGVMFVLNIQISFKQQDHLYLFIAFYKFISLIFSDGLKKGPSIRINVTVMTLTDLFMKYDINSEENMSELELLSFLPISFEIHLLLFSRLLSTHRS